MWAHVAYDEFYCVTSRSTKRNEVRKQKTLREFNIQKIKYLESKVIYESA